MLAEAVQADLFGATGRTDAPEVLTALEVDYTPPAVAVQLLIALSTSTVSLSALDMSLVELVLLTAADGAASLRGKPSPRRTRRYPSRPSPRCWRSLSARAGSSPSGTRTSAASGRSCRGTFGACRRALRGSSVR